MLQNPFYKSLENSYLFWHLGLAISLFLIGYGLGGHYICDRTLTSVGLLFTASVNSAHRAKGG
ncbi:hypothetical protein SPB21_32575 [Leptothoe sp. ISB3NOV94-8A]